MFRIEVGPDDDGRDVWLPTVVVDHERDAWLTFVSGMGLEYISEAIPVPGQVMKLVWTSRVIPFDYLIETITSEHGPRHIGRIENFGTSRAAGYKANLRIFRFDSEAEREAAELLAAEALLVFGTMYNGLSIPDGILTVELRAGAGPRPYTLSDFGYESEAGDRTAQEGTTP